MARLCPLCGAVSSNDVRTEIVKEEEKQPLSTGLIVTRQSPPPQHYTDHVQQKDKEEEEEEKLSCFSRRQTAGGPHICHSDNGDMEEIPDVPNVTARGLSDEATNSAKVKTSKVWMDWQSSMSNAILRAKADSFVAAARNDGKYRMMDDEYHAGCDLLKHCRKIIVNVAEADDSGL